MSTILQDAGGQKWLLGVADDGELLSTAVASGDATTPILVDILNTVACALTIETDGTLTTTGLSPSVIGGLGCVDLISPDGTVYDLMVDAEGLLVLYYAISSFEVGQLYPQNGAYPLQSQPGGAGTPVTSPLQAIDEKTGRYAAGCGHFFNNWDIGRAAICQNQGVALVRCPVCLFIVRIIRPYAAIHTQQYELIGG